MSAGYFTPSANSVIYNFCPSAVSSSAVGSTSCPASSCPAGYGLYSSSCVPCPPGAYSAGGTAACTPVPAGRVRVKPTLKILLRNSYFDYLSELTIFYVA